MMLEEIALPHIEKKNNPPAKLEICKRSFTSMYNFVMSPNTLGLVNLTYGIIILATASNPITLISAILTISATVAYKAYITQKIHESSEEIEPLLEIYVCNNGEEQSPTFTPEVKNAIEQEGTKPLGKHEKPLIEESINAPTPLTKEPDAILSTKCAVAFVFAKSAPPIIGSVLSILIIGSNPVGIGIAIASSVYCVYSAIKQQESIATLHEKEQTSISEINIDHEQFSNISFSEAVIIHLKHGFSAKDSAELLRNENSEVTIQK